MDLSIESHHEGAETVVTVVGELDMHTGPLLAERLEGVVEQGPDTVVVEMTQLTFMDSSGLSVLLGAHKSLAERGGSLILAGPNQYILKTLDITGLTDVLPVRGETKPVDDSAAG